MDINIFPRASLIEGFVGVAGFLSSGMDSLPAGHNCKRGQSGYLTLSLPLTEDLLHFMAQILESKRGWSQGHADTYMQTCTSLQLEPSKLMSKTSCSEHADEQGIDTCDDHAGSSAVQNSPLQAAASRATTKKPGQSLGAAKAPKEENSTSGKTSARGGKRVKKAT